MVQSKGVSHVFLVSAHSNQLGRKVNTVIIFSKIALKFSDKNSFSSKWSEVAMFLSAASIEFVLVVSRIGETESQLLYVGALCSLVCLILPRLLLELARLSIDWNTNQALAFYSNFTITCVCDEWFCAWFSQEIMMFVKIKCFWIFFFDHKII